MTTHRVAIIGGGPAGLMAAETLAGQGMEIDLYDGMPSVGRKFLLAGKGGMNLTHSEAIDPFLSRFGARREQVASWLARFEPQAVRDWARGLGVETFIGSSGRVFPVDMKAAPLLRAWRHRLLAGGVRFHMRHRWEGWASTPDGTVSSQSFSMSTPEGKKVIEADAVLLALGGASWARLGSDGAWMPLLREQGVAVAALQPANCGFDTRWSEYFSSRFAGHPVKGAAISYSNETGRIVRRPGEFMITQTGIEGSLVYALSAGLRERIAAEGQVLIHLDLAPGKDLERVSAEVAHPRGSRSMSSHLQSRVGIAGVKSGLLRELAGNAFGDPALLAARIKALPILLHAPRPIDEAISSAGGVSFDQLDQNLMLRTLPGVFCAGEMLDWEAPTGGYLLTACFASGRCAGEGILNWFANRP